MENNKKMTPRQSKQPSTIEELQQWYIDRHLPPERVTRFFIGKDIREPKAFGIYKDDSGDIVVYKNKADGQRAVRYQGRDEAFAVGELLSRLKEEIQLRKAKNPTAMRPATSQAVSRQENNIQTYKRQKYNSQKQNTAQNLSFTSKEKRKGCFLVGIVGAVIALFVSIFASGVPNGYYHYNDNYYYHLGTAWYLYNELTSEWTQSESLDKWITEDNVDQYSTGSFSGRPFEETGWYEDYYSSSSSSSDDDDSSYDWDDDDDSWDSDDTDWDDDW